MHKSERLDGVVRLILITVIGFLPVFFIPLSWVLLTQAKVLFVATALFIAGIWWLRARFSEGGVKLPWTWAMLAAIVAPVVYVISSALAGFQGVSLLGTGVETDTLAFVCVGFSLFALSASVFSMHPGKVVNALRALLAGGTVLLAIEVLHFLAPSLALGGSLAGQTGNLLGSWHEFSMFAGLLGFLSVSLMQTAVTTGLMWRILACAAALLSALFLMIANYFDVLLLTVIACVFLILVKLYRGRKPEHARARKGTIVLVAGGLFVLGILVFGGRFYAALPETFRVAHSEVRPSFQGTFAIGQQSLSRPLVLLFGTGPNTFTREWGLHKPLDVNQTDFWNVEFTGGAAPVATSFVTVGVLGLLAWIAFMLATLIAIVRLWLSPTETAAVSIALPLSLATLYLFALYVISAPGVVIALLMFFCAGLLIALLVPSFIAERAVGTTKGALNHALFAIAIVGGFTLVICGGAIARASLAETLVNKGIVRYNATQDIEAASKDMQRALYIYPGSDRAHTSAVQLGLASLEKLVAVATPENEALRARLQATLEETIQHGLSAVAINGGSYENWLLLASLYSQLAGSNVDGAYENARLAFDRALAENPTSPIPYLNLARLELIQKRPDEALRLLARAVQLKQNFAIAYYMASQIYAIDGDYESALQTAIGATRYAPEDAEAWYNLGVIAYGAKHYSDAAIALQQALVIQPRFANAMYVLGLALYQEGGAANALTVFNALNALDPGQEVVEKIIAALTAGTPLTPQQLSEATQEDVKETPAKAPQKSPAGEAGPGN